MRGSYCIAAVLEEDSEIEVGKLGRFLFTKGLYVYTGSALSSLEGRLGRHLGSEKKARWHIDYLLEKAAPVGFVPIVSSKREECSINSRFLEKGEIVAKGFGSSDCDCVSHLVYLGD